VSLRADLTNLLKIRRGHFELESGHHGDVWLDLESLCRRPRAVRSLAAELAQRLATYKPDIICGPLVEGAFVGLLVADDLDAEFIYTEPRRDSDAPAGLFRVRYDLPAGLRQIQGRRVAIVNDVINAGSAVLGTLDALAESSAEMVAIGALLTLGSSPAELAGEASLPLETLASEPSNLWTPETCPLCREGLPLISHPDS
jgi:orotate phosphoribosyltransferase